MLQTVALAVPENWLERRQHLTVYLQPSQIWLCLPTPVHCKCVKHDFYLCHSVQPGNAERILAVIVTGWELECVSDFRGVWF